MKSFHRLLIFFLLVISSAAWSADIVQISVDATEAPRRIFHMQMSLSTEAGPIVFHYPRWIPGNHAPTGPVENLVGLRITSSGKALDWRRDSVDRNVFHVDSPGGKLQLNYDFVSIGDWGANGTENLLNLNWHAVLLYPAAIDPNQPVFAAALRLPTGWKYGTALPVAKENADSVEFVPVSLHTLIDSPVIAGRYFRSIALTQAGDVVIDIVADSASKMDVPPEIITQWKKLVAEANSLFGVRHYRNYHFLLTLSNHNIHNGVEHHESSDNRVPEDTLVDEDLRVRWFSLLPHEVVHSWNGKYRRPAGLINPDYIQPQKTELLWVYEGLANYLGFVLAARSTSWTPEVYRENLARLSAILNSESGRSWRPLTDTAVSVEFLRDAPDEWNDWRRGLDYYTEGGLIWLEADVLIRKQTNGKRSLDDFLRLFFGGPRDTPPEVVPYELKDIIDALQQVHPYDWHTFLTSRVNSVAPTTLLNGIREGGWSLVYNETPNTMVSAREKTSKYIDLTWSLGMLVKEDGVVRDVIEGGLAAKAGIGPGMKIVAVNSRRFEPDHLRGALKGPVVELLIENQDYFRTLKIEYSGGEKYPHIQRDASQSDIISDIIKPRL